MSFVIYDTEYIAEKGLLEEGFTGWKNREIIQIAALKVTNTLEVADKLNLYVKPLKNAHISNYFSALTGITDETLSSQGLNFPEAYEKFHKFAGRLPCYSHCWTTDENNTGDGEVINETMSYYGLSDANPPDYRNIGPWFRKQYALRHINIKKQASGEIASLLGLEDKLRKLNLQPHNSFYDVYSILTGLRYLEFRPD